MMRKTTFLLAVSAVVMLSCSAPASAQVASGGGDLDEQRQFSFSAVQLDDDGTAVGQMILKNRTTGGKAHVSVACLVVDGDTAIIFGVVTQVKKGFGDLEVGDEILLGVRDNGEGNDAPADRITGFFLLPEFLVDTDCEFRSFVVNVVFGGPANVLAALLGGGDPIDSGNIQVLP